MRRSASGNRGGALVRCVANSMLRTKLASGRMPKKDESLGRYAVNRIESLPRAAAFSRGARGRLKPPDAADRRRLFVAFAVDAALRASLERTVARLAALHVRGRFVPPENFHITVAFLGYADIGRVGEILGALQTAAAQITPFDLAIDTVGAFRASGGPASCGPAAAARTRVSSTRARACAPRDAARFHLRRTRRTAHHLVPLRARCRCTAARDVGAAFAARRRLDALQSHLCALRSELRCGRCRAACRHHRRRARTQRTVALRATSAMSETGRRR